MVNRKIAAGVVLSVVFAAIAVFPVRAGAEEKGGTAPALENILACKAIPAEPAADAETQVAPSEGLFAPEPTYVCLSGWCSSDTQCVQWYGTGSRCVKSSGASCGHCLVP